MALNSKCFQYKKAGDMFLSFVISSLKPYRFQKMTMETLSWSSLSLSLLAWFYLRWLQNYTFFSKLPFFEYFSLENQGKKHFFHALKSPNNTLPSLLQSIQQCIELWQYYQTKNFFLVKHNWEKEEGWNIYASSLFLLLYYNNVWTYIIKASLMYYYHLTRIFLPLMM